MELLLESRSKNGVYESVNTSISIFDAENSKFIINIDYDNFPFESIQTGVPDSIVSMLESNDNSTKLIGIELLKEVVINSLIIKI